MQWQEIRERFPHRWIVVEARASHSEGDRWVPDDMEVIGAFDDGLVAWRTYAEMHRKWPRRDFVPLHTENATLDIKERRWVGVRPR